MEAYTDFAAVYDLFMEDTPYEAWAERILALLAEYDEKTIPGGDENLAGEAGLCVDLGCGTGRMTRLLAKAGLDMIGIDSSFEMLETARSTGTDGSEADPGDRAGAAAGGILYLNQDMREFELYSTVGAVVSVCDCVNYLLTEEDILACFGLVNNYLYPRGLFIFDFNTVHKYRDVIGDTTIAENRDEGSFIWENYYDDADHINEYDLTMYIRQSLLEGRSSEREDAGPDAAAEDGLFVRTAETHVQRGYEVDEMLALVRKAGMQIVKVIDADTDGDVTPDTERALIVAREVTKQPAAV